MYSITYGDDLLYDPLDADVYPVFDVSLSAEINGSGSCEFSITKTHPLYDVIDLYDTDRLVTVTEDSHILFKGYVASVDEDEYGVRTYSCTGILSFLKKSVVRPYSTDAEDEKHVKAPSTIDGFFNWLISEHDNHTDRRKRFIVGRNEGDIVRRENVIHASSDSASTTANVLQSELLDGLGGYVFVRYGDDGVTYLDYLSECRDTNAQIIDFGVNLVSYSRTDDATDVATVCYAKGGTPEKDKGSDKEKPPIDLTKYPDGPFARGSYRFEKSGDRIICLDLVDKYGYSEMTFEDSDLLDPYELLDSAAIALLKQLEPKVTIDIRAIDLSLFMDGYEPLRCGELVRVRSDPNGFDSYMLVSGMDLDLESPENTEYTLGTTFDAFTGESNKIIRQLNATINKSVDQVTALDQTTKDQAIQIGKVEDVANDASDKADNAQNTANNAQNAADNAQNTANNAQNTANANKEAINSIKDAQTEYEKRLEQMQQGVEQAEKEIDGINGRLDQMDTEAGEVQASIDAVRQEAQTNFETAKNAADAAGQRADAAQEAVDSLRESTSSELQNVKDSVSGVRSDVDAVEQKAADLASELDGTKATVEQVTTDLGEVKTTVSNAATKADQALQVSTSASQTATEAKTTATSAYQDAQSALTQSSTASQTANAVKTELETKYSTTDEIAEQYATKSLVEQTSQSITSTVEATYATKATVEALENIANNAVQTWMGSGVPTLSNKPASDWNTAELKAQHSGDIYYDTDTGYSYRFGSSDGKNYSWSLIKDTDISKAVADAAKAQQTAEGVSDEVTQLKTDIPATYATKTEVKQTTDSIKSSVSEVATTANSALSKATTVEQTAKGLQTTVTEQAEKLDGAVTTISQVSQRVDSVSSTITQVSGRVDDVEDKADAAQGTANSALSQASRVEQSLDSFKTSVSRDYQTKTDALSQKSELEQNINSFKTTVSETYTTKDEFNALEIGGTNLIKGSKPYGKSGFFEHFNSVTDNEYGELTLQSTTTSQSYPNVPLDYSDTFTFDKTDIVTGDKYVISYDVMMLERTYTASSTFTESWIGIRHNGGNWSGLIRYDRIKEDFLHAPLNEWAHFEHPITANAWDGTTNVGANIQLGTKSVGKFRFRMRNVKLEKGTKATAWSPAPEDFDGKYTSKTEFKQTTDKISATATAASQNASSALSKISSLEVSVDGIDTKVEEVASDADEAVKTASQVSQRVDSLTSTITQVSKDVQSTNSAVLIQNPGFETGDLAGWTADNWSNPRAEKFDKNMKGIGEYRFNGYAHQGTSNYSYLRSKAIFGAIPGKTYKVSVSALYADSKTTAYMLLRRISDNARPQITKAIGPSWTSFSGELTVPSDWSIGDNVRFEFAVEGISSGTNRILADDFSIVDVTDAKTATDTAKSALSKSSSVEQNLNSFKTNVSQTYETKSDASNKQSSLQQSVNNLRTEVSETYTTKTEFNNLQIGGTNLLAGTNNGTTGWTGSTNGGKVSITAIHSPSKLVDYPRIEFTDSGSSWRVATYNNTSRARTIVANSAGKKFTLSFDATVTSSNGTNKKIEVFFREDDSTDNIITFGSFSVPNVEVWNHYELTGTSAGGSITKQSIYFDLSTAMAVDGTAFKICNLKLEEGNKATPWSPAPEDLLSTADAAKTYSTKSYVDQTSRTVSLGVVEEYKNGQHGSALATQSDITATKNSITQTVSQTYLSKTDATNTYLNKDTAASTYATKTEVKQTSDSLTVTISSAMSKAESAATAASNAQNTANTAKNNAATAQSTANTAKTNAATAQSAADKANTNAQNAQNRVGNLETCIKMTSDGVRVGKISNGNFTGYSALVNSEGSFDILNASGTMSSRFSDSMIELGKNNSAATISMLNDSGSIVANTNGLDISSPKNVQLTAGGKNSSQTFMVKSDGVYYKNRKIYPPFNVLEKQIYSDIEITAYSYAGFVSVNVRRWSGGGVAWFPPAENPSIIGKINPDYAPKQDLDVLVGIHGNAWLELTVRTNGDIGIYTLYSPDGVNVEHFGGLANYLPKNALV